MLAVCDMPYLTRRQVIMSNKAKVIEVGKETLLCTLELRNKETSRSFDDIHLEYELYARSSLVEELNVAHCCLSRISRDKCNVYINVSASTVVNVTKVKLDLGWKYRLADNEVKFKIKKASPMISPTLTNSSRPDISALSMSDETSQDRQGLLASNRIDHHCHNVHQAQQNRCFLSPIMKEGIRELRHISYPIPKLLYIVVQLKLLCCLMELV